MGFSLTLYLPLGICARMMQPGIHNLGAVWLKVVSYLEHLRKVWMVLAHVP